MHAEKYDFRMTKYRVYIKILCALKIYQIHLNVQKHHLIRIWAYISIFLLLKFIPNWYRKKNDAIFKRISSIKSLNAACVRVSIYKPFEMGTNVYTSILYAQFFRNRLVLFGKIYRKSHITYQLSISNFITSNAIENKFSKRLKRTLKIR